MSDATLGVFDGVVASARLPPGAPGLYLLRERPLPVLGPQRMDVACFVGVAPRGPAYVPVADPAFPEPWRLCEAARETRRSIAVAVSSFDEFRRRFGGFEGPGLLARAVAAFFEQGGRRAHIVRIVAPRTAPVTEGRAAAGISGVFTDTITLRARDQGAWGNALAASVALSRVPLRCAWVDGALQVERPADAPPGTLLQLIAADGARGFCFVASLAAQRPEDGGPTRWIATLDPAPAIVPVAADIVTASLLLSDGAGREERHDGLALDAAHPRWIASVLCAESLLAWPDEAWAGDRLTPAGTAVEVLRSRHDPFAGGADFYAEIVPAHFFDPDWSAVEERAGEGVAALADLADATQLVVPDLYLPAAFATSFVPVQPAEGDAGAVFSACVETAAPPAAPAVPPDALSGLILDPRRNDGLAAIQRLQSDLVAFAEDARLIALLDVPPGLTRGQAERWRAAFDSSWVAAYHPWLRASRGALAAGLVPLPPSAVAAGIVARKEFAFGLQAGPANEIATGIVDLAEPFGRAQADAFHPIGLNGFLREMDGIRLTGARTLSRDPQWRQLSVRRLVLMLRRTLLQEMQWAVFEPNGPKLARDLRHAIEGLLRRLFRAGAFAGTTEQEAFFVRIRQDRLLADRGEILSEIGVAPVEPLEFILLRLRRDGDGTLGLEE